MMPGRRTTDLAVAPMTVRAARIPGSPGCESSPIPSTKSRQRASDPPHPACRHSGSASAASNGECVAVDPTGSVSGDLDPAIVAAQLTRNRLRLGTAGRVALLAGLAPTLSGCIPSESATLRRGDRAPVFTAVSLQDGSSVSLADYRGKTLLVNLWATWCHPCKTETPYLQSLYEQYKPRGLRILGISIDRRADREAVVDFVEEMGVGYDIVLDPAATSRDAFLARGLPTSVLINGAGTVAFSWIGPVPEGDRDFLAGLEEALELTTDPGTESG